MKYRSEQYCPNCHFPLAYRAKFCAQCGQKNEEGRMSVGALFRQVWFRVLHLESRSFRFMWLVLVPGFVTQEFFRGHRKRFPQPIRFFFILAFIFLFTLNHRYSLKGFQAEESKNGLVFRNASGNEGSGYDFYEKGKRYAEFEKMRQEFDSLPAAYRTPVVQQAVDSLLKRTYGQAAADMAELWTIATDSADLEAPDSISLNIGFKSIRLAALDAFRLDAPAIAEKYGIDNWLDQILLRQSMKTLQDPSALIKTYIGSLAWTLLALVGLMAAALTLLYWRQKRYYVEHFIFLLNEHSAMFLLLTLAIWVQAFFPLGKIWYALVAWLLISPFWAMRRFYGQSWGLTIFKSTVFSIAYLFGFILLFSLGMLVVFVIF
ncbi:MAG: zinc ribbon domain-containing protein [Saprospirales bacterium]|jgi:hypothetical protein|nr:zinc ribbon domain-containing protein [Saprospirales bacterium]MBK8922810.1 zinc ribbon domain-containing protein [Saprospirales bacterium]